MRQTQIFSGSSHPLLVQGVCDRLGIKQGEAQLGKFSNGETSVQIQTSIRNQDVFIIQSGCSKINDAVFELLIMASACKGGSAKSVTAVMPYFPYSRQSKKKSHRGAITARMLANLLNIAGINHVITMDLHASQMQGFFRCPVDNLIAEPLIARWIRHNIPDWQQAVVVSKNAGGSKRVTSLADALKLSFGIITTDRRRFNPDDFSVNGSVIFERYGNGGTLAAEEPESKTPPDLEPEPLPVASSQIIEEKVAEHNHRPAMYRRSAPSRPATQRIHTTNAGFAMPSSPLAKSVVPERSPRSSPVANRLVRVNTAPEASVDHNEQNGDEFIDERARDVIHGRLVHGHIVDDDVPSPSISAVSSSTWRSRYNLHHRNNSSEDDDDVDLPPNMYTSFMSTASSVRRIDESGLGGTAEAAASDEEEEEDLKNPELETMITLVGNVRDRPVFIVDDIIDKAGSWVAAAECCVKRGFATKVYCMATHGLFGEDALREMEECECIEGIIVTNTFPISPESTHGITKLILLDVAPLLAEAIRRNHHGENISQLYMQYND